MTENEPAAADRVSDGLVVRGRPPFAMTPTSLLRNPAVSSHAVRLWSVPASYTYGDQATDRPSRAQRASDVGWKSPRSVDTYLAIPTPYGTVVTLGQITCDVEETGVRCTNPRGPAVQPVPGGVRAVLTAPGSGGLRQLVSGARSQIPN